MSAPAASSSMDAHQESSSADVAAAATSSSTDAGTHMLSLEVKHRTRTFTVRVPADDSSVGFLRKVIEEMSDVPASKNLSDSPKRALQRTMFVNELLRDLGVKNGQKIMLIGDPNMRAVAAPEELDGLPDVLLDFDVQYMVRQADVRNREQNEKMIDQCVRNLELHLINPLRPGKKLLVLDIDYTVFDCKSVAPMSVLRRPYLDEFLTAVYEHYDICFWSQTKWTWIEAKLTEMGLLNPGLPFRVSFILDRTVMFPITVASKDGGEVKHEVKSLAIIWRKLGPAYSERNVVHVDDLGRNFALNPSNGIRIRAYKDAPSKHTKDRELSLLTKYLLHLAQVPDVSAVDHQEWRKLAKHHL